MDETNPYAPPEAEILANDADASRIRYEHLRTEGHLKALGWLWVTLASSSLMLSWFIKKLQTKDFDLQVGIEVISLQDFAVALISTVGGFGLVRLQRWAGNLMAVVSAFLIAFKFLELPGSFLGIVVHAVMLRFLFDHKTRLVLSPRYGGIIKSTPLVNSNVASWVKPVIVLFLIGLAAIAWVSRA